MNFELSDKLTGLIENNQLDEAIEIAETELKNIPQTNFHSILGKDLLHLENNLAKFIDDFYVDTLEVLNQRKGFFQSLFGSKVKSKPMAFYCEMNGFTINYDRWFIDLFAYRTYEEGNSWDWLSDFYDHTATGLTITGFEDIQNVFRDVHENELFQDLNMKAAYEITELIVILRLQELFRETYKNLSRGWALIPIFVTAHDYEMIYRVTSSKEQSEDEFWTVKYGECAPLTDDMVFRAERILGVKFPSRLIELLKIQNGGYINNYGYKMNEPTSWSETHVPFDELYGLDPDLKTPSVFNIMDVTYLTKEWGFPEGLIPLSGDGHWFIALDYRKSEIPQVRWIDTECDQDIHVADSFDEFIDNLLTQEQIDELENFE